MTLQSVTSVSPTKAAVPDDLRAVSTFGANARELVKIGLRSCRSLHLVELSTARPGSKAPPRCLAINLSALPQLIAALEKVRSQAEAEGLL